MALQFHPLANIFPFMDSSAFAELVADVEKNGVHEPVWLYDGEIIDGRHRYKAAQKAGVECPTRDYVGNDPVSFVLSLNLNRRHLNESQRGMVAANLANMPEGKPNLTARIQAVSQKDAAEKLNVSRNTVQQAVKINKTASPELVAAVASGDISINAAAKVAKLPEKEQRNLIASGPHAVILAGKNAESDDDAPDMAQLAGELQAENEAMQRQIKSLESDDTNAELVRLNTHLDQLNGRLQGEITTRNEAQKMVKFYADLLAKIRKALNVENNKDILAAIK